MAQAATRVLAVLELLQTHRQLSGAELAERLGLDRRTLRRYIVTLEEIGIPIMAERGRYGGYSLMPGYKLPPMMFTDDEALALALGLLAARNLGFSKAAPAVESAKAKLERIMPARLQQRLKAIDEAVQLDLAHVTAPDDNAVLVTLSAATMSQQRVYIRYCSAQAHQSERNFDPYGLVFYLGNWYVVGLCHLRAGIRTFRLDRIKTIKLLSECFRRPVEFNALTHLRESVATIPRSFSNTVLLKTDLKTARGHLFDAIGLLAQTDSGVMLYNQSDDLTWFARQLVSLPFDWEVQSPSELRDTVVTLAKQILQSV
ncbi:YafY family protein [Undibacterium sp. 5I1]|uniref:helix-turn-helix transcriptional regulator n=1 Tax=unclassified Undibacterium TaxID=2630295 RepID=UPI002AB340BC|nr:MULTISPECIES: YafY family protein [unclassified Undibacterium]MDY7537816.1 YafY family protein [Undibacterium sp. 5I1]MEB0229933.1 YafY family protein [Undibacterium sp. 10I3]MEB0257602.1 YafY family protein [Undibacterium sp. 5I1]